MTAKDYIYLGLLAFSAIAFYWIGFYGGFNTTLKMLQAAESETDPSSLQKKSEVVPQNQMASISGLLPEAGGRAIRPKSNRISPAADSSFGLN
ncbi:MAG: hypothetical protein FJ405_03910 [Verrucomicrobia bacterium]|nr:hypothetical protein [Verrucomicrobiota bacterium]